MPQFIIRSIRMAHCKRGPLVCRQCREEDVEKICLLETYPPGSGDAQRRMIDVEVDGKTVWREYDVVRTFDSEQEARDYAEENSIQSVTLCRPAREPGPKPRPPGAA